MASAMSSARPLETTIAPSPIEPARMPRTFGSSARAAEPGVMTPVRTIISAPPQAATSAATRPNDAATITAARTASATPVFAGCGTRLPASCHSATAGLRATTSALSAARKHVSPGTSSDSWSGFVVRAAMIRSVPSRSKSCSVPGSPAPTLTAKRRCAAMPNSGTRHSAAIPVLGGGEHEHVAGLDRRLRGPPASPSAGCRSARSPACLTIPSAAASRFSASADAVTGISTRQSLASAAATASPAQRARRGEVDDQRSRRSRPAARPPRRRAWSCPRRAPPARPAITRFELVPISVTDPARVVTCASGSSTSRAGMRRVCSSWRVAGISIATSGVVLISADATPIGTDSRRTACCAVFVEASSAHVVRETAPVWTTPLAITSIAADRDHAGVAQPGGQLIRRCDAQDAGDDERREQRDQRVDPARRHRGQRREDQDGGDGGHRGAQSTCRAPGVPATRRPTTQPSMPEGSGDGGEQAARGHRVADEAAQRVRACRSRS